MAKKAAAKTAGAKSTKQVHATVTREVRKSGETDSFVQYTEDFDAEACKNPARVRIGGGITKQAGRDYEFIRVDVAIEIPCPATAEGISGAYEAASNWVNDMIEDQLRIAEGS